MAQNPNRLIRKRGLQTFEERVNSQLPVLLDRLLTAPKHARAEHPAGAIANEPGIYLFRREGQRHLRRPEPQNPRPAGPELPAKLAGENGASFAFNIARREAADRNIKIVGFHRNALSVHPDFKELFDDATAQVALMPVQFIVEDHADLRTLFEVYATCALGTQEFNTFETH